MYCSLVYFLILLPRDSCATARPVPFRDEKDLDVLDNQSSQQLQTSQLDFTTAFQNTQSKDQFEKESITTNAESKNVEAVDQDEAMEVEELAMEGRELLTHIDYAGATTHPPNEPPKKKSPSTPKSLGSKPRGH